MNTFECTDETRNDPDWEDSELESSCPVCGAEGRVKPPDPGGGLKPIKP